MLAPRSTLLPDRWFLIKGYNSGTVRWEKCIAHRMWEGCTQIPCPLWVCQASCPSTNLGALRTSSFWMGNHAYHSTGMIKSPGFGLGEQTEGGHLFDPLSGHMPGLWAGPQLGACKRQLMDISLAQHQCFSSSLSSSFPLSKNK